MKNRTVLVVNVIDLCVEISKYLSEKKPMVRSASRYRSGRILVAIEVGPKLSIVFCQRIK